MKTSPLCLCLFLTVLIGGAARPDSLPPPVIPQCVGVNIHFTGAPTRDLDGLQSGGFGWIRMDFAWDAIEKVKGQYDFSAYDMLVAGLAARHIKSLLILDYGNDLYQKQAPRSPEAREAFARFAAAAVRHYKGKPILWEIWNEPNGGFWLPRANVSEYRQLAFETARAIKQADPNATVIAPGTAGIPLDFLESVFQTGILRYLDAVSLHPYRGGNPESAAGEYASVRRLIQKYAPKGKVVPLVSSEWGYTTVSVSDNQQADYLARQWLFNLSEGVRLSIWYDWHDDGTDPKNGEHNFGTVHNDYTPKRAFLAAQNLTQALSGYRFVKRLPLASDRDYLLLFAKGPDVKLSYWTTGDAHAVSLPGGRRLTLTPSPQYFDAGSDAALRAAASWTVTPKDQFYSSGQSPTLVAAYHSPDNLSHDVRLLIETATAGGSQEPVLSREQTGRPARLLRWMAAISGQARVPVRVRVGLIQDGIAQTYYQDAVFTPTDPLELSVAPLPGNRFQVGITNPAGTPFTGRLSLSSSVHANSVPVRLVPGQTSLNLTAPGTMGQGINCVLRDVQGHLVAQLPPLRFVPYPAALPSLRALLDGDLKVPSTVHLEIDPAVPDSGPALRLAYQFAPGWSFVRVAPPQAMPLPGKPVGMGLWVYGDSSGNSARMRLRDASGQTFQPTGPDVDWQGWRFVSFRLVPPPGQFLDIGHWGGANDGHVHYPVQVDTLFLLDSRGEARRHQGMLRLKQPTVIYTAEN